ncbi:MAG: SCO family protein [Deltaproteobacteria bacterium]|nr:SCO family protein [Deltaproteobacteria bacterium]
MRRTLVAATAMSAFLVALPSLALEEPDAAVPLLVDVIERLGEQAPLEATFVDQEGIAVRLGDYFSGGTPVLLVPGYFRCRMLCGLVFRGIARALARLDWEPGRSFRVVTVSIDPRDGPSDAARAQSQVLEVLGKKGATHAWPFLVGSKDAVAAVTQAVGYQFEYDPRTDQYAHPAAVVALSPSGKVSRYLYGLEPKPRDLKLALLQAAEGKTASLVDRVLLTCFRYDPASRRYELFVTRFMRIGSICVLVGLVATVAWLFRLERQRKVGRP